MEMAAFSSIGNLLKRVVDGQVYLLMQVWLHLVLQSFLIASSVIRTRQAHQVTAASLYRLMKTAYTDYCSEATEN